MQAERLGRERTAQRAQAQAATGGMAGCQQQGCRSSALPLAPLHPDGRNRPLRPAPPTPLGRACHSPPAARPDLLPKPYLDALSELQDRLPSFPSSIAFEVTPLAAVPWRSCRAASAAAQPAVGPAASPPMLSPSAVGTTAPACAPRGSAPLWKRPPSWAAERWTFPCLPLCPALHPPTPTPMQHNPTLNTLKHTHTQQQHQPPTRQQEHPTPPPTCRSSRRNWVGRCTRCSARSPPSRWRRPAWARWGRRACARRAGRCRARTLHSWMKPDRASTAP